jgi:hypothetical protein
VSVAQASSWQQVTLEELTRESAVVFEGRVIGKAAVRGGGKRRIFTRVTFEVRDGIKGAAPGEVRTLDFLGGTLGEETLSVVDMRLPEMGEEGIYFVEAIDGLQAHPLYGWDQGRLLIKAHPRSGQRWVMTSDGRPVYGLTDRRPAVDARSGEGPRFAAGLQLAPRSADDAPLTPEALKDTLRDLLGRSR